MRRIPGWAGWLLALAVACGFVALGRWQLDRAEQKRQMLAQVAQVIARRRPVAIAAAADPARARGYDWTRAAGRFAPGPALLLDNQVRDERLGVHAYRVFLPEPGPPLLVDLGWLPLPVERRLPAVPVPAGRQVLSGLLAPPPAPGLLGRSTPQAKDGQWLALGVVPADLAGLLHQPGLAPRVLRLDPALPLGYPRDLDVLPNTLPPERHLGYAVQWFALAAAVLATATVLAVRRRTRAS
ncbi:MAG: SURF1 family protein [Pseudomonas sp.]